MPRKERIDVILLLDVDNQIEKLITTRKPHADLGGEFLWKVRNECSKKVTFGIPDLDPKFVKIDPPNPVEIGAGKQGSLRGTVIYANKTEAQRVFAKYMRTNDRDVLEDSYNGYIKTIPKKPYPTLKGIQFMLEMLAPTMPEAKNAKPEQFVDLSFLQELEKEGFFVEMTKRYPSKG